MIKRGLSTAFVLLITGCTPASLNVLFGPSCPAPLTPEQIQATRNNLNPAMFPVNGSGDEQP